MLKVGLTGGIGAGKSSAARRLEQLGAVIVDADQVAREVVAPGTAGLAEVTAAFGENVLAADGSLDRPALAAKVFSDPAARQRLEAIVHPRVRQATAERVAAAAPDAVVVNDVPLLVETGLAATFDLVIVVEAPEQVRIDRLVRDRGMTPSQAAERIAAQSSRQQRLAAADVVLDNSADVDALHAEIDSLWSSRLAPYEENLRLRRRLHSDERLALTPYRHSWPAEYQRIAGRVRRAMGKHARRVDHVGSTSVPGMPAEDVIDVLVTVADLSDADAAQEPLEAAGFPRAAEIRGDEPWPYAPDPAEWEKRLHGFTDPGRPVRIHLARAETAGWRVLLLMRDWLRAVPAAADEHAREKRRIAESHPRVTGYGAAKEPWFDAAMPRAEAWASATGWRTPGW